MSKANDLVTKFKNEARLLSDDEQELIGVLANFYEAIEDLRNRQQALEAMVEATLSHIGMVAKSGKLDGDS